MQPVTVITHSNGGIVARYWIQKNPTRTVNQVNDLILVAPPNHGVPRAYYGWEGGDLSYEDKDIRFLLNIALASRCHILPPVRLPVGRLYEEKLRDYQLKVHNCLRYGQLISPLVYEFKSQPDNGIISVGWLLPGGAFLQESENRPYPDAPINRLNTPEEIDRLFSGIQGNVYILAGETGPNTQARIPVTQTRAANNPLWEHGRPDAARVGEAEFLGIGDGTVLASSAFLPEAAAHPDRYHPFALYPNAGHTGDIIRGAAVLAEIGRIIREGAPQGTSRVEASHTLVVWVESPVSLLLTDPQGRRAGVDTAGQEINEIPGSAYGDTGDPLGPKFILVSEPLSGDYEFTLSGVADGNYALRGLYSGSPEPLIAEEGTIQLGEERVYKKQIFAAAGEAFAPPADPGRNRLPVLGFIICSAAALVGCSAAALSIRRRQRRLDWQTANPEWMDTDWDKEDFPPFSRRKRRRFGRKATDDFDPF
jgi:hypothetical protein